MSQENVEIVRRSLKAFNRGDIDGALDLYDPQVEVKTLMSGSAHGRKELRAVILEREKAMGAVQYLPEDLTRCGRHDHRGGPCDGKGPAQRNQRHGFSRRHAACRRLDVEKRTRHQAGDVQQQGRGPRSRRTVGVGDVAGALMTASSSPTTDEMRTTRQALSAVGCLRGGGQAPRRLGVAGILPRKARDF
jgi:ketosteroid isomerase-like protein